MAQAFPLAGGAAMLAIERQNRHCGRAQASLIGALTRSCGSHLPAGLGASPAISSVVARLLHHLPQEPTHAA
jgi:hypothetical protein